MRPIFLPKEGIHLCAGGFVGCGCVQFVNKWSRRAIYLWCGSACQLDISSTSKIQKMFNRFSWMACCLYMCFKRKAIALMVTGGWSSSFVVLCSSCGFWMNKDQVLSHGLPGGRDCFLSLPLFFGVGWGFHWWDILDLKTIPSVYRSTALICWMYYVCCKQQVT